MGTTWFDLCSTRTSPCSSRTGFLIYMPTVNLLVGIEKWAGGHIVRPGHICQFGWLFPHPTMWLSFSSKYTHTLMLVFFFAWINFINISLIDFVNTDLSWFLFATTDLLFHFSGSSRSFVTVVFLIFKLFFFPKCFNTRACVNILWI